jgi:DNA-binding CsgD family transcriptional regulator
MVGELYERERDLAVIEGALDEVVVGRGRVVAVEGPAGIGKTSLLESARHAAQARGFAVASARGSELELAYAWGIVRQLLEPRLRGMSSQARRRAFAGAAALAAPVVSPDAAVAEDEVDASFGVLHGVYWLVAGLAAQRRQALVVDDLHWADGASTRFLEFLVNRLDAVPVLLLVAQRPRPVSGLGALGGATSLTAIELSPLSARATAAVLAERDGEPVSSSFAHACHDATGGNPLLIRRLADGLRNRGISGVEDSDAAAVTGLGPDVLAGTVGATLAHLGAGPVRLAHAVAVLERPPLATAARLAAIAPEEASAVAEQLVRAGILRDVRPLEFVHGLVRDAVVVGLSAGEHARLHGDAARLLERSGAPLETIAVHLLHADPDADAAVAVTLAEVGRRALASGALAEAAALLSRALAEPPPVGERSELLLDLARAEQGLGRPEALTGVLEAHRAALSEFERAQAALALMWATGPGRQDPNEALAIIERSIQEIAGRDRELELRLEATRYAVIFTTDALLQDALGEPERFANLQGRTAGECELLTHVAVHRFLSGRSAAEVSEPLERAVADAELVAAIGPDSAWLFFALGQLFKTDRLDVARRTAEIALAKAQREGSAPGFAMASAWRAWIALRQGDGVAAEADARAAYDALDDVGMWQHVFPASCLIEVLVERGELDEAQAVLEATGYAAGPAADRGAEFMSYVRPILREARGDWSGALAAQLESHRDTGERPDPDFDGWLRLARLLHATGDEPRAAREAEAALTWARRWDTPAYIGQALTVLGLLHASVEELREAVDHLERSPARRELARSLLELGGVLRRGGERTAAREPLRRALDIASSRGLLAIAQRARGELRLSGAKVRRPASTGLASLTPSEQRIVELAAGGASNPEIAQGLFVTVKTVEMHLGNAYRKLGISSRRELTPLIAVG